MTKYQGALATWEAAKLPEGTTTAGRRFQRRENTKRRVHVLRIESARLAMRAARALRLAARAERYIPPGKGRAGRAEA